MKESIVSIVHNHASNFGDSIALVNPYSNPQKMTYRELYCEAVNLANYLSENVDDTNPIVVYGHKNPYMIVCFLACVMSGHAYCPVDFSLPGNRLEMILEQTNSSIVLATEKLIIDRCQCVDLQSIQEICLKSDIVNIPSIPSTMLQGNQTYYIIFTSGSTGTPKGVEISLESLDNFLKWSHTLGEDKAYCKETVFLNQAPFSFDLSVMDLYTSLYCGATLCMMEKHVQERLSDIVPFIKNHGVTAMVATPSFGNMCLVDRTFNSDNIPSLTSFFFCGETLLHKTAEKLKSRFPNAVIQNAYGPTESTVAVSNVRITNEILKKFDPLPVGVAKPGTEFIISDNASYVENGCKYGEILIAGDSLANGYYKRTDLTQKVFIYYGDKRKRVYSTGDLGYMVGKQLFFKERIDLQMKLNGYRIEIGDIESSILRLELVSECAVVPRMKDGQVKALVAVVVINDSKITQMDAKNAIIEHLKTLLPFYMIPQNYEFINRIPMTNNGKINRKELIKTIEEE